MSDVRASVVIVCAFGAALVGAVAASPGVLPPPAETAVDDATQQADRLFASSETEGAMATPTASGTGTATARTTTPRSTPTPGPQTEGEISTQQIERVIHRAVNEQRRQEGLTALDYDTRLAEIARRHSKDMATKDYFSHTSPSGDTFQDRYEAADYECQVEVSANRYATGGENIAFTWAYAQIETETGSVSYDGNETQIARGIVRGWMNSKGHRENILTDHWQSEGIGVAITETSEGVKVYATQNFC